MSQIQFIYFFLRDLKDLRDQLGSLLQVIFQGAKLSKYSADIVPFGIQLDRIQNPQDDKLLEVTANKSGSLKRVAAEPSSLLESLNTEKAS